LRPPLITIQPRSTNVVAGQRFVLAIAVTSFAPMTLRWQKNDADLEGENNATLLFSQARPNDAASYRVILSNEEGSVTSSVATVTVLFSLAIATNGVGAVSTVPNKPTYL